VVDRLSDIGENPDSEELVSGRVALGVEYLIIEHVEMPSEN
jgi:hypothetical protein